MKEIMTKLTLCNPYSKCGCPTILIYNDGTIIISDDYGNRIKTDFNDLERLLRCLEDIISFELKEKNDNDIVSILVFENNDEVMVEKELKMTVVEFMRIIEMLTLINIGKCFYKTK